MTSVDRFIIKAACLNMNLCLYLACLNSLDTVESRIAFNNGDLSPANIGQSFQQYMHSKECCDKYYILDSKLKIRVTQTPEMAEQRFRKDGFNLNDIRRWLVHLQSIGRIKLFVWLTFEAKSFDPVNIFYQRDAFILLGWCVKDVNWDKYKNALKKCEDIAADRESAERLQSMVYKERGFKAEYKYGKSATHAVSVGPSDSSFWSEEESKMWNRKESRIRMPANDPLVAPCHYIYDNGLNIRRPFTIMDLAERISFPFEVVRFRIELH